MFDNLLEVLLDTIPYSVWMRSSEGEFIYVNQYFCDSFNMSRKDVLGSTVYDLYKDNLAKEYIQNYKEVEILGAPKLFSGYQGGVFLECYIAPIKKESKIVAYLGILREQTERKKYEEEIIKQKNLLKTIIDTIPDSIFYKDIECKYLDCNVAFAKDYYNCSKEDVIGKKDEDLATNFKLKADILTTDKSVIKSKQKQINCAKIECNKSKKYMEYEKATKLCDEIKKQCKNESYKSMQLSISLGCATKTDIKQNIEGVLKDAEDQLYKEKLPSDINSKKRTLNLLSEALEEKSLETKEHTDRVVIYAKKLAKKMELDYKDMKELIISAKLHDIGKIGIPDVILQKPGKLTNEEFEIMKIHTEKGYRVAKSNYEIAHISNNILSHHERWDGNGYPLGLKGDEIPFLSRIICIVDSYDAMISKRAYKNKMTNEEALKEIEMCSGSQFDPEIVKIFIDEFKK